MKKIRKEIKIVNKERKKRISAMKKMDSLRDKYENGDNDIKNLAEFFSGLKNIFTSNIPGYNFYDFHGSEGMDFINFTIEESKEFFEMDFEIFQEKEITKILSKLCKRFVKSSTKMMISSNSEKIILENLCNFQEIIDLLNPLYNDLKRDVDFEKILFEDKTRESVANILSTIGEIKHWVLKIKKKDDLLPAVKYFIEAANINPFEGKNFYLLSNCTISIGDTLSTINYLCLAIFNDKPYKCNVDFLKILEKISSNFKKMQAEEIRPQFKKDLGWCIQAFYYSVCSTMKKIFTERNRDKVKQNCIYSSEYFNMITNELKSGNIEQFLKILKQSFVLISSIFYLAEEENDGIPEDFFSIEVQVLEDLVIGFIPLFLFFFKFFFEKSKFRLEKVLEAYTPFFMFLRTRKYIIYCILASCEENFRSEMEKFLEDYESEIQNSETGNLIAKSEIFFLGFLPLKLYYTKISSSLTLCKNESKIEILLTKISNTLKNNFLVEKAELEKFKQELTQSNYSFHSLETDSEMLKEFKDLKPIQTTNEMTENKIIIIDGLNVAIRYGINKFKVKGIEICINYWKRKGHQAIVILPDYCFSPSAINHRKSSNSNTKKLPDDPFYLQKLQTQNIAFSVPNMDYDDSYMLQYAKDAHGYIVSNDKFKDHIRSYGDRSFKVKNDVKKWVAVNVISYAFIGDTFMPNPDFMKKHYLDASA